MGSGRGEGKSGKQKWCLGINKIGCAKKRG